MFQLFVWVLFFTPRSSCAACERACVLYVDETVLRCRSFVEKGRNTAYGKSASTYRAYEGHTRQIIYGREECQVKNGRTETDMLGHRRFILF